MALAPITTVAEFKAYAGITSANQDALIASLIEPCVAAIGAYCNRPFSSASVTEYRDGNGSTRMQLAHYPITSFSSLIIDGKDIPRSVNGGPGYVAILGSRVVMLVGYKFTASIRNVVASFVAGYGDEAGAAPWPDDLQMAAHLYMLTRIRERERIGVGSKALAGESVTFVDATSGTSGRSGGVPSAAAGILKNYANTVPETGL